MKSITDMSSKELLDYAEKRIFSISAGDLASRLSHRNIKYGLGRIMYATDDDAYCVMGPDATITRDIERWENGFAYGQVIKWKDDSIFFPGVKPNGCGMVFVKLDEIPPKEEIFERIAGINENGLSVNGSNIEARLGAGNHFLEFHKPVEISQDVKELSDDCRYALLHSSAPEREGEIYKMAHDGEEIKTPIGKISTLEGNARKEYFKEWEDYVQFCSKRREVLIKEAIGDCEVISNTMHQGIFAENEVRIGCYNSMDPTVENKLFPITLRWDLPVFIVRGKPNISDATIDMRGFKERAVDTNMLDELKGVNILPHGGGYTIKSTYTNIEVIKTDIGKVFVLSNPDVESGGEQIIKVPRDLPFDYRGMEVIESVMKYDLADQVAKLKPLMTIKI